MNLGYLTRTVQEAPESRFPSRDGQGWLPCRARHSRGLSGDAFGVRRAGALATTRPLAYESERSR